MKEAFYYISCEAATSSGCSLYYDCKGGSDEKYKEQQVCLAMDDRVKQVEDFHSGDPKSRVSNI